MILFDDGFGLFDDAVGNFDDGGVASPTQTVSGIELTSSVGTVTGAGDGLATANGIEATASVSEVLAIGENDAIATVEGVTADVTTGTVTAVGSASKKGRKKSNAKFLPFTARPVEIQVDGRAQITTQTLKSGLAEVTATGTHNARANVRGLQLETVCRIPTVDGIINPSDDEIIWLLAA